MGPGPFPSLHPMHLQVKAGHGQGPRGCSLLEESGCDAGQSSWEAEGEDSTPVLGFLKRVLLLFCLSVPPSFGSQGLVPALRGIPCLFPPPPPPPSPLPRRSWEQRVEDEEEERLSDARSHVLPWKRGRTQTPWGHRARTRCRPRSSASALPLGQRGRGLRTGGFSRAAESKSQT